MTQKFDGLSMPLQGIQLIEASAGTGKTFSLAGLYLRLLLEQQLDVADILVMTFTRAATRELRERIRARLNHAADIAAGRLEDDQGAEAMFARELFVRVQDQYPNLAVKLRDTARRMDEAVILTIHSFSQRAAAEQAFDSALPFDRGEAVDDTELYRELTGDYWRQRVISHLDTDFQQQWNTPDALFADLKDALINPSLTIAAKTDEQYQALLTECRQLWATDGEELTNRLAAASSSEQKLLIGALKKALPNESAVATSCQRISEELQGEQPDLPDWLSLTRRPELFSKPKRESDAVIAIRNDPLLASLLELQQGLPSQRLARACLHIQRRAQAVKAERQQYSFNDMISLLHQAITGPNGEALAQQLHDTWPWALVDEFQDTDPQQYEILQRCYHGRDRGGLILIGDPKQAIYSFRGGDVHAYLKAAADADAARYTLDANFRSNPACLNAFEALFRQAGAEPFLIPQIHFESVHSGRHDQRSLQLDGQCQDGLNIWHWESQDEKPTNKGLAEVACQQACLNQVRQLLSSGEIQQQHDQTSTRRPVKPQDIAILVNKNAEASRMQAALARRGIASVCVHQQSVFASTQANDLLTVLRAVESPADSRLVRAALTTPLFAQKLSELRQLQSDEQQWSQTLQAFANRHELWRRHGVLALLQDLIQSASARLQQQYDADRCVSNYLQLAELLAEAQSRCFGMTDLIHYLASEIGHAEDVTSSEAAQLRLESDAAAVRILTVHKSKGLEFPIVLMPFAPWLGTGGQKSRTVRYHSSTGQNLLALAPSDEQKRLGILEKRAESLRLFYVAITRAELACYLPFGAFNAALDGPLASLLMRDQIDLSRDNSKTGPKPKDVSQAIDNLLSQGGDSIRVNAWPSFSSLGDSTGPASPDDLADARSDRPSNRALWSWRISSFSGLVRLGSHSVSAAGAEDESDLIPELTASSGQALPELPGGVNFGNAVHEILENLDDQRWQNFDSEDLATQTLVEQALLRHGITIPPQPLERLKLVKNVAALLQQSLVSPLPKIGPLAQLAAPHRRAEMEFHLRIQDGQLKDLLQILQNAGFARHWQLDDLHLELRGLLHGYIDLIVMHEQTFYVLDYKTNYLGPNIEHYAPAATATAMADHDYELQALLYLLALHRYLRQRISAYDPAQHLGGALYLFLRGMHPQRQGFGVHQLDAPLDLLQQMDQLFGGVTDE